MFSQASHNSKLSAVAPVPGEAGVLRRVAELIEGLQPDDADLLKGLHRIQHEFHYVPSDAIPLLAAKFETTPAIIYGTIDFYSELRQVPPATDVVEWCSGPACRLKNSMGIRRALEAQLGCAMNEQSADGQRELRLVQCDGTCHLAPLIRYEGRYIGPLATSEAITFARELTETSAGSVATEAPLSPSIPQDERVEAPSDQPEALGSPGPGAQVLPEARETELTPRPPVAPDVDPTREPGE